MTDHKDIEQAVIEKLSTVMDPETGRDVIRMGLIPEIKVDPSGSVKYTFRPSSPLCPLAVVLALNIIRAIAEIKGVSSQEITVVDYIQADELNGLLREEIRGMKKSGTE